MGSCPKEIDELDRKVRQLEIEREAIRREKDKGRIEELTREIDELNAKRTKACANETTGYFREDTEEQTDARRSEVQAAEAERNGDYGRVARCIRCRGKCATGQIRNCRGRSEQNARPGDDQRGESMRRTSPKWSPAGRHSGQPDAAATNVRSC